MSETPKCGDRADFPVECESHGQQMVTATYLFTGWSRIECPHCVRERDEKEAAAREELSRLEEKRYRDADIDRAMTKAEIPMRYSGKGFNSYIANSEPEKKVKAACEEYAASFRSHMKSGASMIVCGNAGTGKTHLACSVITAVICDHGVRARYTTASRAFRSVKNTFQRGSNDTEGEALAKLTAPDLLVIDEVGVQFGSDFERNILFEIINERYVAMKPTILISNLSLGDLKEFVGERVLDRMKEGGGKVIVFDWDSYRGKKVSQTGSNAA